MILARYFEHGRERLLEFVDLVSNLLCNLSPHISPAGGRGSHRAYMLIYEDNTNVFSVLRELIEGLLNF